jgi:hypothetical protein
MEAGLCGVIGVHAWLGLVAGILVYRKEPERAPIPSRSLEEATAKETIQK